MITSIHNPKIQRIRDLLAHSRSRTEQNAFVLEGIRLVEEAAQFGSTFDTLFYSSQLNPRGLELIEKLNSDGVMIEELDTDLMNRISATETSQGIIAIVSNHKPFVPSNFDSSLVLDSIRDPGNLGTILRTASAAGVQVVFLSQDCVDNLSPKVLRAAMGAHFHIPVITKNWFEIASELTTQSTKPNIYLSDVQCGTSLWECDFRPPTTIIISNEANGASSEAQELANDKVHIPMPGGFESLNASIAAAVLLFEVVRQRKS
jgi:TrmH family RNA methyltransferase